MLYTITSFATHGDYYYGNIFTCSCIIKYIRMIALTFRFLFVIFVFHQLVILPFYPGSPINIHKFHFFPLIHNGLRNISRLAFFCLSSLSLSMSLSFWFTLIVFQPLSYYSINSSYNTIYWGKLDEWKHDFFLSTSTSDRCSIPIKINFDIWYL